jgi:pimeloyl-ACP methyl ester carboxylesterase
VGAEDLFVDSDGVRLAVRDHGGAGTPVVLVHGHFGSLGSFDVLGPLLAGKARPVAYDQRGHGWSDQGPVSVASYADDLAAVIAALQLTNPEGRRLQRAAGRALTPQACVASPNGRL